MSTLEEKLEKSAPPADNVARATLKQLRGRWGFIASDTNAPSVLVECMGQRETWRRGKGQPASDGAVFELVARRQM
jgi:hypothetical protein